MRMFKPLAQPLGADFYRVIADPAYSWYAMLEAIDPKNAAKPVDVQWCAMSADKPSVDKTCTALVQAAFADALDDLKTRYGAESNWQWGTAHALNAEHRPFDKVKPLAAWFSTRTPLGGDNFTVNQLKHRTQIDASPYTTTHGAGYRGVFDMSTPVAQVLISTGQSGQLSSAYYKNQLDAWLSNTPIEINIASPALSVSGNVLKLIPKLVAK